MGGGRHKPMYEKAEPKYGAYSFAEPTNCGRQFERLPRRRGHGFCSRARIGRWGLAANSTYFNRYPPGERLSFPPSLDFGNASSST
jgi:hypothetical protein